MSKPAASAPAPVGGVGRPRLVRPVRGRLVAGAAQGLADHLRISVILIRVVFVLTAVFSGAGLLAYLLLWAIVPGQVVAPDDRPDGAAGDLGRPRARASIRDDFALNDGPLREVALGGVLVIAGLVLLAERAGLNLRLGLLLPLLAVGAGAVVAWSRLDQAARERWVGSATESRNGLIRLLIGIAMAGVGLVALLTQGQSIGSLGTVAVPVIAVLIGAALLAAPWGIRLWEDFRREQAARIRETERADIAAHLHDSVLQTLALIQRKAAEPAEVTRLARAQERELRSWLYAAPPSAEHSVAAAVRAVAHEVEDLHGTPVELVVTGDRPLDDDLAALVRAIREALLNAVRHGRPPVSAYVEIGPDLAEAFVRDHGTGFDVDAVPADRLGVRESIIRRMGRHGGSASIRRMAEATEVRLALPIRPVPAVLAPTAAPAPTGVPEQTVVPEPTSVPEPTVVPEPTREVHQ